MDIDLGYKKGFKEHFDVIRKLGTGGNGTVWLAKSKDSGEEFAVKTMPKVLKDAKASDRKKALQIPSIKQEVEVLLALRGSLNVANIEEVYEDDKDVHIVMEYCRGGELLARAKKGHVYSERSVASIMRSVLQTVAQCHAKNIIHRDIKADASFDSPIKAIDFGLATFFDSNKLPITAVNPEGTLWFLAPESCRAKWWPVSDVWACGILAAYMLTGFYPFVDRVMPTMPDMARTLKVICFEELKTTGKAWEALTPEAVDFVKSLLVKDHTKRPAAVEALKHPWLNDHDSNKKALDRPLHKSVVQRIQRYSHSSLFKRTILAHIAHDLVGMHFSKDATEHGRAVVKERSVRGGSAFFEGSSHYGRSVHNKDSSTRSGSKSKRGFFRSASARNDTGIDASIRDGSVYMERGYSDGVALDGSNPSMHGGSIHGGKKMSALLTSGYLPIATPFSRRLAILLDGIDVNKDNKIDREELKTALQRLGYKLNDTEADELFDAVDINHDGQLDKADVAASLLDWQSLQDTYKDRWLSSVKKVFSELDKRGTGAIGAADIANSFGVHLTDYEVDAAVHEALIEALGEEVIDGDNAARDTATIDFDHFLKLLQDTSADDLMLYDERLDDHSSRHVTEEFSTVQTGCGASFKRLFGCGA